MCIIYRTHIQFSVGQLCTVMGNNHELTALFRKFIDNTCEEKELEKFYEFLPDQEATSQIHQLLEDLWDVVLGPPYSSSLCTLVLVFSRNKNNNLSLHLSVNQTITKKLKKITSKPGLLPPKRTMYINAHQSLGLGYLIFL